MVACAYREAGSSGLPEHPGTAALSRALAACAAATLMPLAGPGYCADDFPPPIGTQSDRAPAADARAAATPDAASQPQPGTADDASAAQPAPPKAEKDVRIEQKHVGRRVSEVIVTPAGFTYHYTMTHLDDQDPGRTLLQPHPELSVPRFFRIDF
jgi:hypothetical protein